MMLKYRLNPVLSALLLALALAGCDKKPAEAPASQVAAKVNDAEITVHQVNQLLAKAGNVPQAQQDQVRTGVIDNLVNQQLLAARALEEKLDRTPETLMAIESARREVLARAYVEKVVAAAPKLDKGDVARYYFDHPELFAERKIYNLQELTFQASDADLAEVKALAQQNAPADKIVELLKKKNLPYRGNAGVKPAEQLPQALLKQLHAAKIGDSILLNGPQGHTLIRVNDLRKMPVDEAAATPAIQRFLANQRVNTAVEKEIKGLKEKAKVEYVGSFAHLAKLPAAPAPTAQSPVAPVTETQASPAAPQTTSHAVAAAAGAPATGQPFKLPPLPHEDPANGAVQLPAGAGK